MIQPSEYGQFASIETSSGFKEPSGQDVMDDSAFDIGEAKVSSAVREGQFFVVEAELMQDGGVQVVDVDFVFHRRESKVVGRSVDGSAFDSAARQPHGETVGVVVSAVATLRCGSSAKLAAPDDERFFKQAALFEISEQLRDRLVNVFAQFLVLCVVLAVGVPGLSVAVVDLHKSHAFFAQSPSQQTRF